MQNQVVDKYISDIVAAECEELMQSIACRAAKRIVIASTIQLLLSISTAMTVLSIIGQMIFSDYDASLVRFGSSFHEHLFPGCRGLHIDDPYALTSLGLPLGNV